MVVSISLVIPWLGACANDAPAGADAAAGADATAGTDAAGAGNDGGPTRPPWTASSKSLQITCGGIFHGVMRFRATREQLSAEQLQVLANLKMVAPDPRCLQDAFGCYLEVTHADGSMTTSFSSEGDFDCSRSQPQVVAYASLAPLVASIPCRLSKKEMGTPMTPEERCWNGVFVGADTSAVSVFLEADAPGPRHIELGDCDSENRRGKLTGSLQLPPATNVLATLMPVPALASGADHACAALDYTFPQAGTYRLQIDIAPGFLPLGDFFLKYH